MCPSPLTLPKVSHLNQVYNLQFVHCTCHSSTRRRCPLLFRTHLSKEFAFFCGGALRFLFLLILLLLLFLFFLIFLLLLLLLFLLFFLLLFLLNDKLLNLGLQLVLKCRFGLLCPATAACVTADYPLQSNNPFASVCNYKKNTAIAKSKDPFT